MEFLTLIGLMAGFITTMGFVPQIYKSYRTGSMKDVSLIMPLVLMAGMTLWLIYGIYLQDLPIIFWNAVAIGFNVVLVLLKVRSGKK
jgi:MtN3 and saliva related transmembrane protein